MIKKLLALNSNWKNCFLSTQVFPAASVVQSSGSAVSPSSAFSPKVPEKTPVVSQAAVSQLVRKELEKSLAQIEFPKPPAQDIYFLPNTNNSEFLMCLGLEEVAKCVQEHLILKQIKADVKEQQQQQANNESDASKMFEIAFFLVMKMNLTNSVYFVWIQ